MSDKMITVLFNSGALLIVLVMQILMPKITRKNILFGVKIPMEKMAEVEVKNIIEGFQRDNLVMGIPALIGISIGTYLLDHILILVLSTFVYMGILFLIYFRWNKKSKELKRVKGWDKLGSTSVVVDMKFSRDKEKVSTISQKWFLIPIVIIVLNIVMTTVLYPSLPNVIPTHWNFKGNVDGYMNKSVLSVSLMPLVQVFIGITIYLSYYFMLKSKQQIDPSNPEISIKKNIIFRKAWAIYFIVMLTMIEILFTGLNMMTLGLFSNMKAFNIYGSIIFGAIIAASFVLSIALGQGGDRIKLRDEKETSPGYDIDDDILWKFGNTMYCNPEDASIFVEKRVGVGWTVNIANPIGVFLVISPILMPIAIVLLFR